MNDGIAVGKDAITVNEALPYVSITRSDKDNYEIKSLCFVLASELQNEKERYNALESRLAKI